MHVLLGPELLCRLLADDDLMHPQARRYMDTAQQLSIPASAIHQLIEWKEKGTIQGDPNAVLSVLTEQGMTVIAINQQAYKHLLTYPGLFAADNVSLLDRLLLAQAITEGALLLTENQRLAVLAPDHALWLPAQLSPTQENHL